MLSEYDFNFEYPCSEFTKSRHFTKCMYLMINLDKFGIDVFKEYVEQNPDEVLIKNEKGWTPLIIAARNTKCLNLFGCIEILLKSSTFKKSEDISKYVNMGTNEGDTALSFAAWFSNTDSTLETVELLLKDGANPNCSDDSGYTPLILSSKYSNTTSSLKTVDMLLKYGANIDFAAITGYTSLMEVAKYSHSTSNLKTVKFLLDHKANVNSFCNGWTPLMLAARNACTSSNIQTVKLLLKHGANPNIIHSDGRTALSMAVRNSSTDSNLETVKLLLESGADPNLWHEPNDSCLNLASAYSHTDSSLETVEVLLRYGAELNSEFTDLQPDAVKLIILFGAIYNRDLSQFELMRTLSKVDFKVCIKCINMVSHQKLCFKRVLQEIRVRANDFVYRPQSLRTKFMFLKYNFDKFGFEMQIPRSLQVYLSCKQISKVTTTTSQTFEVLQAFLVGSLKFAN